MGASPHRLIAMLFQGARKAIAQARLNLQLGEVGRRGEAIGKAIQIIEQGLQLSLNRTAGGEIADRLHALYGYMSRRLLEANVKSNEAMLIEVDGLLAQLEAAWTGIGPEAARIAGQVSAETTR
jgi:flagellar protein FliS